MTIKQIILSPNFSLSLYILVGNSCSVAAATIDNAFQYPHIHLNIHV